MRFFFYTAAAGLVLSLVTHLSTFFGVNPNRAVPAVWLLHVGIFLVWVPALIAANKIRRDKGDKFWEELFEHAPAWMVSLVIVFFLYTFFNFFFTVFYLNEGGVPGEIDDELVLHSHGKVIRKLTREEFQRQEAYTVRAFSGHWMMFYSLAMAALYARLRQREIAERRLHYPHYEE